MPKRAKKLRHLALSQRSKLQQHKDEMLPEEYELAEASYNLLIIQSKCIEDAYSKEIIDNPFKYQAMRSAVNDLNIKIDNMYKGR